MAAYWICASFTLVSALVSLGYSIAAVHVSADGAGPEAKYALVRSVGLVATASGSLLGEHRDWLLAAATAMVVVQVGDALVGVGIRDRLKTFGPAATALINLVLLIWYVVA